MMAPFGALFVLLTLSFANCKTILSASDGTIGVDNSKVINITNLPVSLSSRASDNVTDILVTSTMRITKNTAPSVPTLLENVTGVPIEFVVTEVPPNKINITEPIEVVFPVKSTQKSIVKEISSVSVENMSKNIVPTKINEPLIVDRVSEAEKNKSVSAEIISSTTSSTTPTTLKPHWKRVKNNSNLKLKTTMQNAATSITTQAPRIEKTTSQNVEKEKTKVNSAAKRTKISNLKVMNFPKDSNLIRNQRVRKKFAKNPIDVVLNKRPEPELETDIVEEIEIEEEPILKQSLKSDKKNIDMQFFVTPNGNVFEVLEQPEETIYDHLNGNAFRSSIHDKENNQEEHMCRIGNVAVYTDIPCDQLIETSAPKKPNRKAQREPVRKGAKHNLKSKTKGNNKMNNKRRNSNRKTPISDNNNQSYFDLEPSRPLRPKITGPDGHSGNWMVQRKRQQVIKIPKRTHQQYQNYDDQKNPSNRQRQSSNHKQNLKKQSQNHRKSPKQQYLYVFQNSPYY